MRIVRRGARAAIAVVVLLGLAFAAYAVLRNRPQDLPWTALDLGQPIGLFTGRKLAGLTRDPMRCQALLDVSGVRYETLPPVASGERCGYSDVVRFAPGGSRRIDFCRPISAYRAP